MLSASNTLVWYTYNCWWNELHSDERTQWTGNGVCELRWQHISPVVSTFSTSIRLLSSFFIKHCILPTSFSLFLWYPIPFSLLVVFPCGLEMLMFSSCKPKFFAVRHIHYRCYPGNPSSDHFHNNAVVPPSDHYCFDLGAPSGDH